MAKYRTDPLFTDRAPQKHWFGKTILIVFLILVILAACVTVSNIIDGSRVQLLRQSVTVPSLSGNFTILHISDLHGHQFGQDQNRLALAWRDISSSCSVICITGDSIGPDGNTAPLISMLDKLPDSRSVFIIPGDEDPDAVLYSPHEGDSVYAPWILEAMNHGAIYLDSPVKLKLGENTVWFCPEDAGNIDTAAQRRSLERRKTLEEQKELSDERTAMMLYLDYQFDRMDRIDTARSEMLPTDVYIVLTHVPYSETVGGQKTEITVRGVQSSYPVSLTLAGHYNAGQFRLPGIGALWVPSSSLGNNGWFPDNSKISGLCAINSVYQYISPGLATSSEYPWYLSIRAFNTPAVTLLTLTRNMTNQ